MGIDEIVDNREKDRWEYLAGPLGWNPHPLAISCRTRSGVMTGVKPIMYYY